MNHLANEALQQELDMPAIQTMAYGSSNKSIDYLASFGSSGVAGAPGPPGPEGMYGFGIPSDYPGDFAITTAGSTWGGGLVDASQARRITTASDVMDKIKKAKEQLTVKLKEKTTSMNDQTSSFRIVRVVIADPNTNVPLANRILHDSGEITTDLDDRELFFEVNIKEKLEEHNKLRATLLDKGYSKAKDKDMFLEPLRIRDLRMTVITVASF